MSQSFGNAAKVTVFGRIHIQVHSNFENLTVVGQIKENVLNISDHEIILDNEYRKMLLKTFTDLSYMTMTLSACK